MYVLTKDGIDFKTIRAAQLTDPVIDRLAVLDHKWRDFTAEFRSSRNPVWSRIYSRVYQRMRIVGNQQFR